MTVAALAGRRVDAAGSLIESFPARNIGRVQGAIEKLFVEENVSHLVCSCAAGADILGVQVARKLGLWCHILIPLGIDEFRSASVIDRSPDWGVAYDEIIRDVEVSGRLTVIDVPALDSEAFALVTELILREAQAAALPLKPIAISVWDSTPRSSKDYTQQFTLLARDAGFSEYIVATR